MIIKKREVLFSAIIVLVMLLVGLFVSDAILQSAISKSEDYRTATVIENEDQFLYGMQTNFGHSLVYGEVSSDSSVTYDEIESGFIYIEKHKEHYTRHTRTVTRTDSNGKKHTETEVYYSWDHVWSDSRQVDDITFMGETFPYEAIDLPVERLNLDSISVDNRMNYIYEGHDDRYYYNVTPLKITGTIFTSLHGNTINDSSELYQDMNPKDFVTNSSSSSFLITNNSDETMTSKDIAMALLSKIIEDADGRFILAPGESIRYECGDHEDDGAFENFIHSGFSGWGCSERYGNGDVSVDFLESNH